MERRQKYTRCATFYSKHGGGGTCFVCCDWTRFLYFCLVSVKAARTFKVAALKTFFFIASVFITLVCSSSSQRSYTPVRVIGVLPVETLHQMLVWSLWNQNASLSCSCAASFYSDRKWTWDSPLIRVVLTIGRFDSERTGTCSGWGAHALTQQKQMFRDVLPPLCHRKHWLCPGSKASIGWSWIHLARAAAAASLFALVLTCT